MEVSVLGTRIGGLRVRMNDGVEGGGGLNFPKQPRFELGMTVITANAQTELHLDDVERSLRRHHRGDWGDLCDEDRAMNDRALQKKEGRLFSTYKDRNGSKFYIITEWDRSVTTIMLPEDY